MSILMKHALSVSLLCHETVALMTRQLREADEPFEACYETSIPFIRLNECIDDISGDYLAEAADTLMCRGYPLRSPRLIPPSRNLEYYIGQFRGVTVRLVRGYNIRLDRDIYRFDAQYRPEA